jgi:hypothetical protein
MHDALNKELERQELPTISEEIFNWRMAQATPPLMRRFKKERDAQNLDAPSNVDPSSSVSDAQSTGNRLVLPPIRQQPDIAPYLMQAMQSDDRETPMQVDQGEAVRKRHERPNG